MLPPGMRCKDFRWLLDQLPDEAAEAPFMVAGPGGAYQPLAVHLSYGIVWVEIARDDDWRPEKK